MFVECHSSADVYGVCVQIRNVHVLLLVPQYTQMYTSSHVTLCVYIPCTVTGQLWLNTYKIMPLHHMYNTECYQCVVIEGHYSKLLSLC